MTEVWTVDECNHEIGPEGRPIMVVSTKDEAIRRAKALNGRFAHGVILEEDNMVADCEHNDKVIESGEYQYYDIGGFEVDEPFYLDEE